MLSSSTLRQQIESDFEHRYPSILTPAARTIHDVATTGISEIDELLNGGLPVGAISEITGPKSSGRTSIALAFLARRTQDGSVCAWVDANDTFDPESAAANGISLKHLLWVRCKYLLQHYAVYQAAKSSRGHDWTRPYARQIIYCRLEVSPLLSSILQMKQSSMAVAFHSQHGSGSGKQPIERAAV
jgi:hypothetical protein